MFEINSDQTKLLATVTASFDSKNTVLKSLVGTEGLSELFEYRATFLSSDNNVDLNKALGSNITITMSSATQERYINGIIAEFSQGPTAIKEDKTSITEYTAVIKPELWLLTLDQNYLIFQNKNAIDIIKQVLKDGGVKDIDDKVSSCGKVKRDYCVQYGESSFNFISRLMEDEGIYYFFKHSKGKHVLVLGDSTNTYDKGLKTSKIDFIQGIHDICPLNKVFDTKMTTAVNTGSYSTADYNYTISKTKLFSKLSTKWKGQNVYDYPGGFAKIKDGDNLSKIRVQQYEFDHEIMTAGSTSPNLTPGFLFEVDGHYASKFNKKYVVYRVHHWYDADNSDGFVYRNEVQAFDAKTEFRPARSTPKPRIYGSQTAVVTCPSGKEIFSNEYCCVKVHFHWDQKGKAADTDDSSCWIRVAQLLAGSGWGAIFLPRVGQEVVVTFLNGDPDQPLITGCVYNDKFKPPYPEKENMKSTLKTVSFDNKKGFNEIRLNDAKDKEEIYVHAQKDVNIDIINSRTTQIQESNDALTLLKGSRSIVLKSDEGKTAVKHSMLIEKGDEIVDLHEGNLKYTIKKGDRNITLSDGDNVILLSKGNETITLKSGNRTITLSKGNLKFDVKGDCTIEASGNIKLKASKNIEINAGQKLTLKSGQAMDIKSGTAMTIKSGTAMKAQSGTAFDIKSGTGMNIKAGMSMTLKATMNLDASATMNATIKANISATLKGTVAAKVNGVTAELSGTAMAKVGAPMITVGGGMVKLG